MPVHATLDIAATTLDATDRLAGQYVAAFLDHVWAPFENAGEPVADVPTIAREIREKRALAVAAVASTMAQAMERHIDAAIMMDARPPADGES
jgi:hypothetical protein